MIAPSQGAHLVFDRSFLPATRAIMVPHTSDGRVMFAIPWHGHTLVGTTDTPIGTSRWSRVRWSRKSNSSSPPPRLSRQSADARRHPQRVRGHAPARQIRRGNTAALSRDHTIHIDQSGLLTITGGKWTTYRNMAEDCVDQAATLAARRARVRHPPSEHPRLPPKRRELWRARRLWLRCRGHSRSHPPAPGVGQAARLRLPYVEAEVVWAVRNEAARTVEDVLRVALARSS